MGGVLTFVYDLNRHTPGIDFFFFPFFNFGLMIYNLKILDADSSMQTLKRNISMK